jgi:hypothetical protein
VAGGYESGDPALVRSQLPSALGSLLAPETGEAYIVLLTIQPGGGGSPFLFSSDSVDTVVGNIPFTPDNTGWTIDDPTQWSQESSPNNTFTYLYGFNDVQDRTVTYPNISNDLDDGTEYTIDVVVSNVQGDGGAIISLGDNDSSLITTTQSVVITADFTTSQDLVITQPAAIDGVTTSVTITIESIGDGIGGGTLYAAFPFDITLPKNVNDQISTAQLSVTNIDRRLVESIRGQTVAMTVDIEVVLSSETTTTMVKYVDFTWRNLTYDAMTVSGTLTLEDFLNEQVGHIMTAANYKSIFYA